MAANDGSGGGRKLAQAYERRGGWLVAVTWLISRALMLLILSTRFESYIVGDVNYYHGKLAALGRVGLANTLNEYPTPVVWILWLPYGLTGGSRIGYLVAFIVFMLLLDAAFTVALWRTGKRRHPGGTDHGVAIDFWLLYVFLLGPLAYVRFDLLPAVLAGGALLAARSRGALSGALTGLGAAVKLWPALLIGAFAADRGDRKRALLGFVVVGFGLALISLIAGGFRRLISPLTWQSDRGLQVESIWATPLMVARLFTDRWHIKLSSYNAYELLPTADSWVQVCLLASTVATVLGLLVIVALLVRAFRSGGPSLPATGFVLLAVVAIMIITNKTLSPQYLFWLGGPAAGLLLLRADATAAERRATNRVAPQLMLLALLTQLVFPLLYGHLLGPRDETLTVVGTAVTAVRNLALVVFTVECCRYAWQLLGPAAPGERVAPPGD